jgi:hypothetical protein
MNCLTEELIIAAIRVCSKNKWLQRDRFNRGLVHLLRDCKTADQLWLIDTLLSGFRVVNSTELDDFYGMAAQKIVSAWHCTSESSLIVAVCEDDKPDGSQIIIKGIDTRLPRGWKGSVFTIIKPAFQFDKHRIVLVDDFIGTGETIEKKLINLKRTAATKSVEAEYFVVVLAGMKQGLDKLRAEVGADHVHCGIELQKGITEAIPQAERNRAIEAMLELESKLLPPSRIPRNAREKSYNFGYGQSEALFWIEGANIPNNVFPIFWWERYVDLSKFAPKVESKKRDIKDISHAQERIALLPRR